MSVDVKLLELMVQNAELRAQLAEAQEQCVELAVDAGEHQAALNASIGAMAAEIELLRQELIEARATRRDGPTRTSEDGVVRSYVFAASTGATQSAGP